jgi:hypothetical protein
VDRPGVRGASADTRADRRSRQSAPSCGSLTSVSEQRLERAGVERSRTAIRDWISRGAIPESVAEPSIRTESLEGLVDVAIDADTRAVCDPDCELYAVSTEAATYYFEDPGWWFDEPTE